jgi:hypothetical protein
MTHTLPKPLRAKTGVGLPVFIRSAEEAVDAIQALPANMQQRPHWHAAQEALFAVIEDTPTSDPVEATAVFQAALVKEGWNL